MSKNIHLHLSSRESLRKQRDELEKELGQTKDEEDTIWGISTRRGTVKRQLSDVNEEITRRIAGD